MLSMVPLVAVLPTVVASVMLSMSALIDPPAALFVSVIAPSASKVTVEAVAFTSADRTMSIPAFKLIVAAPPAESAVSALLTNTLPL